MRAQPRYALQRAAQRRHAPKRTYDWWSEGNSFDLQAMVREPFPDLLFANRPHVAVCRIDAKVVQHSDAAWAEHAYAL